MGYIKDKIKYILQQPVNLLDYLIGSQNSDGKTKNFQIVDIAVATGDYLGVTSTFKGLISVDEINVSGLDVEVINAYYKIAGTEYFLPDTDLNINEATEGYYRIDNIIGYVGGSLAIEEGIEDQNNPAQLPVAPTTVLIGTIFVYGDTASAIMPPATDIKLKSTEAQFKVYWVGTIQAFSWNQYNTYRWSAPTGNSTIRSLITNIVTTPYLYDGRMFFLINDTGGTGTLTVQHLAGTGNIKFFTPDSTDLIIEKGYIATFKYYSLTSNTGRLELVSYSNINPTIIPVGNFTRLRKGFTKTTGNAPVANTLPSDQAGDYFHGYVYDSDDDIVWWYPETRWDGTGDSDDIENHIWDTRKELKLPGE